MLASQVYDGHFDESGSNIMGEDCGSFDANSTELNQITPQRLFVSSDNVFTVGYRTTENVEGRRGMLVSYQVGERSSVAINQEILIV